MTTTRPAAEGVAASLRDAILPQRTAADSGDVPPARAAPGGLILRHLAVLVAYLAAGIAVTWPRATYLIDGKLPATRDAGTYVWDFWWVAHQVEHLGNPWFTRAIAAPDGAQLGYHALMPLEGLLMLPVTAVFGPSASYNLLSALIPGLLGYAMYRVARLWLTSQAGALAAGAFFGLSAQLCWHAWYQLNLAAGVLFLPIGLEAAVRLRRRPGWRNAAVLGAVLGACLLTDQESVIMAGILVALALLPWLVPPPLTAWATTLPSALRRLPASARAAPGRLRRLPSGPRRLLVAVGSLPRGVARLPAALASVPWLRRWWLTVGAMGVMVVVGAPQIAAMVAQDLSGGASFPQRLVDHYYVQYGASLPRMFEASPDAVRYGLTGLTRFSYRGPELDGVPTFGVVLTALAVLGLVAAWRRRNTRLLGLLWLGCAAVALGSTLKIFDQVHVPGAEMWDGVRVSAVMPYTWFVQLPGLSGFREAARIIMLGLVPASLLAGALVDWLRRRAVILLVPVLVLAAFEMGWGGNHKIATMATAMPKLDAPIAADHSGSVVVDVPFGVRGGIPLPGEGARFDPEAEVLATADGHPRSVAYLSRIPLPTLAAIRRHPFYLDLITVEGQRPGSRDSRLGGSTYPVSLAAAREDARRMDVGWVVAWQQSHSVREYLAEIGFKLDYTVGRVLVYRPER